MLGAARERLQRAALVQHAQAEADQRAHWAATAADQEKDRTPLTVDPEMLNIPSARVARLVANVAHTLVVCPLVIHPRCNMCVVLFPVMCYPARKYLSE